MRYTYSYITLHYWPHKGISAYQLEYGKGSWPNNCLGIRNAHIIIIITQPAMDRLETVVDNTESPITTECDVKLSVIGVLCVVDIPETCNDVSNW